MIFNLDISLKPSGTGIYPWKIFQFHFRIERKSQVLLNKYPQAKERSQVPFT